MVFFCTMLGGWDLNPRPIGYTLPPVHHWGVDYIITLAKTAFADVRVQGASPPSTKTY